jgi:hypothetical protein
MHVILSPATIPRRSRFTKIYDFPLDVDDPPDGVWDVLNFFEHVSMLANNGYLDEDMVE